jgi:hypothetical protein
MPTKFAVNVVIFALVALFMEVCFRASEAEDCWRLRRQVEQGHPVTVPEWCEGK